PPDGCEAHAAPTTATTATRATRIAVLRLALQLGHDLQRRRPRPLQLAGREGDRRHHRVTTAAVALGHLGQVVGAGLAGPGVGADRDLGAALRGRHVHAVAAILVEIVGDELVDVLDALVGDVEEDHAAIEAGPRAHQLHGAAVLLQERSD